jgi:hypothetical protein
MTWFDMMISFRQPLQMPDTYKRTPRELSIGAKEGEEK